MQFQTGDIVRVIDSTKVVVFSQDPAFPPFMNPDNVGDMEFVVSVCGPDDPFCLVTGLRHGDDPDRFVVADSKNPLSDIGILQNIAHRPCLLIRPDGLELVTNDEEEELIDLNDAMIPVKMLGIGSADQDESPIGKFNLTRGGDGSLTIIGFPRSIRLVDPQGNSIEIWQVQGDNDRLPADFIKQLEAQGID